MLDTPRAGPAARATYRLTIPDWHPSKLNEYLGRHWSVKHRLKRHDAVMVGWYARAAAIPPATGKRRVSLVITLAPRQRAFDVDAPWKSLLDALTGAGLLVDDSPRWCELGTVEFIRGPARRTEIFLEDLTQGPF